MTSGGYALLTGIAVLVAGAGVILAAAGWWGWPPRRRASAAPGRIRSRIDRARTQMPPAWRARYRPLAATAAAVGSGVWLLSGWPVHGMLAAAVILGWPWIWSPGGSGTARIRQLEELAEWLQQIASLHAAGIALEQTVRASAPNAPVGLRPQVGQLAARLQVGWRPEDAYRAFADDLGDGAADHAVLLLLAHARDRGAGLTGALKQLSRQVAEDTAMLRKVDSDRASLRAEARWITVILIVLAAAVLSSAMAIPYQAVRGQVVLAVLAAGLVAVLAWMRRIATAAPDPRLLQPPAGDALPEGGGR